jgi:hypothetical protein
MRKSCPIRGRGCRIVTLAGLLGQKAGLPFNPTIIRASPSAAASMRWRATGHRSRELVVRPRAKAAAPAVMSAKSALNVTNEERGQ